MRKLLAERMREYAETHPRARERFNELADALDACGPLDTAEDIRHALGCWARARRAWSEETGEPLI